MKNKRILLRKYIYILTMTFCAIVLLPSLTFAKGAVIGYLPSYRGQPYSAQLDRLTHVIAYNVYPRCKR